MDQLVGEIRLLPYQWVPAGWVPCDGQVYPIAQYQALYNVIGATYGGDGKRTFAVPNLQERVPIGAGAQDGVGPTYKLGQTGGTESVTLNDATMPAHSHTMTGSMLVGGTDEPVGNHFAKPFGGASLYRSSGTTVPLGAGPLPSIGNGHPHSNMMPVLAVQFCIAVTGE